MTTNLIPDEIPIMRDLLKIVLITTDGQHTKHQTDSHFMPLGTTERASFSTWLLTNLKEHHEFDRQEKKSWLTYSKIY
jgi:hypothetical protein